MKKIIWFTEAQMVLLEELKNMTGYGNSLIVRESMKMYAENLGIRSEYIDAGKVK